jgi:hypothetical protein
VTQVLEDGQCGQTRRAEGVARSGGAGRGVDVTAELARNIRGSPREMIRTSDLRFRVALVACLCATVAVGSYAARRSAPAPERTGTTSVVIPRLIHVEAANAVAEVQYLRMIPVLVDREHRPIAPGDRKRPRCRVVVQDPRPATEVVLSDLTVTVTLTVRC